MCEPEVLIDKAWIANVDCSELEARRDKADEGECEEENDAANNGDGGEPAKWVWS